MDIFPAIDLVCGACVRLRQGDFEDATVYETDPLRAALSFAEEGAKWLHIVDLDGAKDGAARQTALIERLAKETPLAIQAGGGVRTARDVETLLKAGVRRVIVGSLAVQTVSTVQEWMQHFGRDKIVPALDVRFNAQGRAEVLTHGWQESSGVLLQDVLRAYEVKGPEVLLCTDVSRDGMLGGANLDLYKSLVKSPIGILASGGVGSLDDIRALSALGVQGAIVGKALYEKKFTLAEAIHAG